MLLTQIDHVAIAVHDLEAAIDYHARAFGAEVCHREVVEEDGVEEAMVRVGESYLQLTTGTRTDSPISQFLVKSGEGIHHVGYRVDDCAEALAAIVAAGGRAIDEVRGDIVSVLSHVWYSVLLAWANGRRDFSSVISELDRAVRVLVGPYEAEIAAAAGGDPDA